MKATVELGPDKVPFGGEVRGVAGDAFERLRASRGEVSPQLMPKAAKSKRATKSGTRTGNRRRALLVPLEITFAKTTTKV